MALCVLWQLTDANGATLLHYQHLVHNHRSGLEASGLVVKNMTAEVTFHIPGFLTHSWPELTSGLVVYNMTAEVTFTYQDFNSFVARANGGQLLNKRGT